MNKAESWAFRQPHLMLHGEPSPISRLILLITLPFEVRNFLVIQQSVAYFSS